MFKDCLTILNDSQNFFYEEPFPLQLISYIEKIKPATTEIWKLVLPNDIRWENKIVMWYSADAWFIVI